MPHQWHFPNGARSGNVSSKLPTVLQALGARISHDARAFRSRAIHRLAADWAHLPRLAAFAAAWVLALLAIGVVVQHYAPGADAHSYWNAWHRGLYGPQTAFGGPDAYLYSPAFAVAIWPLALLPFPAFYALWELLTLAAWTWLLRPLGFALGLPLVVACMAISLVGNIEWLLALAVVASVRWPFAWALPLLTKVTLGVGIVWYAARGEWRRFAIVLGTVAAAVALTAWLPWGDWLRFLLSQRGGGFVMELSLPAWLRAPSMALLVVWGARTGRAWVLPASVVLASPDVWLGTFAILAALPRLATSAHTSAECA